MVKISNRWIVFIYLGTPKIIKVKVAKKVVRPIIMYGSESWPFTDKYKSRIKTVEMILLRRV